MTAIILNVVHAAMIVAGLGFVAGMISDWLTK